MCRIIYKKLSQKFLDRTKSDKSGKCYANNSNLLQNSWVNLYIENERLFLNIILHYEATDYRR